MINDYLLPERLYKLVPLVYLGTGISIWMKLDTVYALISGALMGGAGLLVIVMRRSTDLRSV